MTYTKLPNGMTEADVRASLALRHRSLGDRCVELRRILRDTAKELEMTETALGEVVDSIDALNAGRL